MEEIRRHKFKVRRDYKIHDRWQDFETKASYLGTAESYGGSYHVFSFEEGNKKGYLTLDRYWAVEIKGIITHSSIAPCGFGIFRPEEINSMNPRIKSKIMSYLNIDNFLDCVILFGKLSIRDSDKACNNIIGMLYNILNDLGEKIKHGS